MTTDAALTRDPPGNDPIERAIHFAESVEPGFAAGLRGASHERIAELEVAARAPLHPVHRSFLARCGEDAGGFDLATKDVRVDRLLAFFQQTSGRLRAGWHLFAVDTADPYLDVFLLEREGQPEPAVGLAYSAYGGDLATLTGEGMREIAGSVTELLCQPLYVRHRMAPKKHQVVLTAVEHDPRAMGRFRDLVEAEGLHLVFFSNHGTQVAELGQTVLLAKELPGAPLAVSIATDSSVELSAAQWWLTQRVGLSARGGM